MESPTPDADRKDDRSGSGVSLETLIIASLASAAAAYAASWIWGTGTLISAAATPVVVALVSEFLHHARPRRRVEPPAHIRRNANRGGDHVLQHGQQVATPLAAGPRYWVARLRDRRRSLHGARPPRRALHHQQRPADDVLWRLGGLKKGEKGKTSTTTVTLTSATPTTTITRTAPTATTTTTAATSTPNTTPSTTHTTPPTANRTTTQATPAP